MTDQPYTSSLPPVETETAEPRLAAVPPTGRHTLPSGGWVDFRDIDSIRQRDRRAVMEKVDEVDASASIVAAMDIAERMAAMIITGWSFARSWTDDQGEHTAPLVLPIENPRILDELSVPDYDAIMKVCEEYKDALFGADDNPDPAGDGSRVGPTGTTSG